MSKEKFKYVNETTKTPASEDATYETWEVENILWLLHCIQLEISKTYILLPTMRDIWDAVKKTYFSDFSNQKVNSKDNAGYIKHRRLLQ